MTAHANTYNDDELVAHLDQLLASATYEPDLMRPIDIARAFGLTRAAVTNWGARTERTGVHRYNGRYDRNEIMRWLLIRDTERADRRANVDFQ